MDGLLLLALVSEPAPAGRSSKAGIAAILLCLAVAAVSAIVSAAKRGGRRNGGASGK